MMGEKKDLEYFRIFFAYKWVKNLAGKWFEKENSNSGLDSSGAGGTALAAVCPCSGCTRGE